MSLSTAASQELSIIEPLCVVFRRALKREGLKYTPERARVLDTLMAFDGPFEAERVVKAVRTGAPRVSKATVYRTLRLLHDAGVVQRVLVTEEQSYYQLAWGKGNASLVIRLDTGEMIPVDAPELGAMCERLCAGLGLASAGHRLQIFAKEEDLPQSRRGR